MHDIALGIEGYWCGVLILWLACKSQKIPCVHVHKLTHTHIVPSSAPSSPRPGMSVGLMIRRICSIDWRSGERPAVQGMHPVINLSGKQCDITTATTTTSMKTPRWQPRAGG